MSLLVQLAHPEAVTNLRIADARELDLRHFEACSNVERLMIQGGRLTGFEALASWPKLHELKLDGCVLEDSVELLLLSSAQDVAVSCKPRLPDHLRAAFRERGWHTD